MRFVFFAILILASCTPGPGETPDAGPSFFYDRGVCGRNYTGFPEEAGNVDESLIEASGIVASPTTPGLLWLHADNGNEPLVSALNHEALTLARFRPQQVIAEDFEDIATAPCYFEQESFCLYVADTGNNGGERRDLGIVVFKEPEVDVEAGAQGDQSVFDAKRIPIRYPNDEGIDSEAFVVEPDGSAFYLFEKVDAPNARVFVARAPFSESGIEMTLLTTIQTPGVDVEMGKMITAADLHPSGSQLLLRVYTGVFEYRFEQGQSIEDLADIAPFTVTFGPFSEPQGEALCYDESGIGLWSISEDPDGSEGQPLHRYACE